MECRWATSGHCHLHRREHVRLAAGIVYHPCGDHGEHDLFVSYQTNSGNYSYDGNYFAVPHDAPPLHAPARGASGNRVDHYGASEFPRDSYNATNYWVDLIFQTQ